MPGDVVAVAACRITDRLAWRLVQKNTKDKDPTRPD